MSNLRHRVGGGSDTKYVKLKRHHPRAHVKSKVSIQKKNPQTLLGAQGECEPTRNRSPNEGKDCGKCSIHKKLYTTKKNRLHSV
jgi:hypothetical protein